MLVRFWRRAGQTAVSIAATGCVLTFAGARLLGPASAESPVAARAEPADSSLAVQRLYLGTIREDAGVLQLTDNERSASVSDVLAMVREKRLSSSADLYWAARVLLRSDELRDVSLAHDLAVEALAKGASVARATVYAAQRKLLELSGANVRIREIEPRDSGAPWPGVAFVP